MLDTPDSPWSASDAIDLYNLHRWGRNFFDVDAEGFVTVRSDSKGTAAVRIYDIVQHYLQLGQAPPLILRFPGIMRQRAGQINLAFRSAINSYGFEGDYRLFYPVKVNQHFEVMQAAMDSVRPHGGGLEAGSKAELFSVLSLADNDTPILCNGFKDATVVEMALRAQELGRRITIVIEKPNELDLVLELAKKMKLRPSLGIRIKLAAKGSGHWSNSGGSKSKFGLSIPELTFAINQLESKGYLECVTLLHFHPGSQITNVRKIKTALIEAARVYVNLIDYGVPIKTIDVGGGLAVDYTGNRNKDQSSMNYTLREYANDVVYQIQMVCDAHGAPHPDIYSESGRALVAHHSLLVVPILGTAHTNISSLNPLAAKSKEIDQDNQVNPRSNPTLEELTEVLEDLNQKNLLESFHDAESLIQRSLEMFSNGNLSLWERAYAERIGWAICMKINSLLEQLDFVPRELQQLRKILSDTYFGNFSLFQALPDAWALKQLFPMMPIHRLDERPTCHGVLGDITCDSDGKIDCFVGDFGDRDALPLHALNGEPYYLAIFLIGAYQEALSDDHNLMGKFHIATINDTGDPQSWQAVTGSDLNDVLSHVHHDVNSMQGKLLNLIENAHASGELSAEQRDANITFFERVVRDYTYLD